MKYTTFLEILQKNKYYIFSLTDLLYLFPGTAKKTIQNQLAGWLERGYIIRLKKGLYELLQRGSSNGEIPDIYVANKLYEPSYVSMETALSIYSIIPDVAVEVSSVTTKTTRFFRNKHGRFRYYSCQPRIYTGYLLTEYSGFKVAIAEKEKALTDYIYFKRDRGELFNIEEERFEESILKELNWKKVKKYAKLYNKAVLQTIKELMEKIGC